MKINFPSLKTRDSFWNFLDNYCLLLVTIINFGLMIAFPILGHFFVHKIGGIILGVALSAGWFWLVELETKDALKKKNGKILFWLLINRISIANFIIIFVMLFVFFIGWISGVLKYINIPPQAFFSFLYYYYIIFVPISVFFGFVLTFGEDNLKEILKNNIKNNEKRLAKYFNPLFLPISVVVMPFVFIFAIYKFSKEEAVLSKFETNI
ncbi:MAG: hypothetical protein WC264_03790 [Candidatus Paceibacterota bacterium]|jgi:hypothetical protein